MGCHQNLTKKMPTHIDKNCVISVIINNHARFIRLFQYFLNAVFMPPTRKITSWSYHFAKIKSNVHFSFIFLDLERRFDFLAYNAYKNVFLGPKRRKSWKRRKFCPYFILVDSFNALQKKSNQNNQIYSIWLLLYRPKHTIRFRTVSNT